MTKSVKKRSTGKQQIALVTADAKVAGQVKKAVESLDGAAFTQLKSGKDLAKGGGNATCLILDSRLPDGNAFEICRRLKGASSQRILILLHEGEKFGGAIARFCSADGSLTLPLTGDALQEMVQASHPDVPVDALLRQSEKGEGATGFPEALLKDAMGEMDADLVEAIIDPETKLFNFAFLNYKVDEEYKRAVRFKYPLSCVMLGFDGEASAEVLLELAGIFLSHSRDTDVLGRFDLNAFLFLLPNTGSDGAKIMAKRVLEAVKEQKLMDLVGEPLDISIGISCCPHTEILQSEDLMAKCRSAFELAQQGGGGVEVFEEE